MAGEILRNIATQPIQAPLTGTAEAIGSGLDWASKFQEVQLRREQLDAQKTRNEELKKDFSFKAGLSVIDAYNKIDLNAPPKLKEAMFKRLDGMVQQLGHPPIDEVSKIAMLDPQVGENYKRVFMDLYRNAGTPEGREQIALAFQQLPRSLALEAIKQYETADQSKDKMETSNLIAAAKLGLQQENQKAVQKRHDESLGFQKGKDTENRFQGLKKQVSKVNDDFKQYSQNASAIGAILKADPELKNPQNRLSILKMAIPFSESKASVLMPGELAAMKGDLSLYDQAIAKYGQLENGGEIPVQTTKNIIRTTNILARYYAQAKARKLGDLNEDVKRQGFQKQAKTIFGESNLKLMNPPAKAPVKAAPKSGPSSKYSPAQEELIKQANARQVKNGRPVLNDQQIKTLLERMKVK